MLHVEVITLKLTEPFRIAHGTSAERCVVRVQYGGSVGEAPFVPYYQGDPVQVVAWLEQYGVSRCELPMPREARLALDLMWHDLTAKLHGAPLWESLGLLENPSGAGFTQSARSLGIPSDLGVFRDKVAATAGQFPVLKLKLGSGDMDFDLAVATAAREAAPQAMLFADANGGWSIQETISILPRLADLGLAFVEQPISHRAGIAAWQALREQMPQSPLPLIADESAQTAKDLATLRGLADGVNVKLLKAGGLRPAIRMMREARALGMTVLLGCMIESSLGVTAAAHLASLADWIDLDGHLYVANDDYVGLSYDEHGAMHLPDGMGIGAVLR
jgi:L-alanine-DL-glutamate epimerase-like enolase superfamily enzyme